MQYRAMRERLALQAPTRTTDSQGGAVVTWAISDSVPAALVPASSGGTEQIRVETMVSQPSYTFVVRANGSIGPTWRALWRPSWLALSTPKTLEIHDVVPDPDDPTRYARLVCGEVT